MTATGTAPVRIRGSWHGLVVPAVILSWFWVSAFTRGDGHALHLDPVIVILYLALTALAVAVGYRYGITLTDDEAVIHNLRTNRVRWADIQAITQDTYAGTRFLVIWTADGRRIKLRAPVMPLPRTGRAQFEAKYHRIGQWWLTHRGPDWQPLPHY